MSAIRRGGVGRDGEKPRRARGGCVKSSSFQANNEHAGSSAWQDRSPGVAVGLGCMGMSAGLYGGSDRGQSLATIRAALDAGVNLLDTVDFYGMGHNESLIGEAIRHPPRDELVISVKFGAMRDLGRL
jgi:Aldo/keto reductase family